MSVELPSWLERRSEYDCISSLVHFVCPVLAAGDPGTSSLSSGLAVVVAVQDHRDCSPRSAGLSCSGYLPASSSAESAVPAGVNLFNPHLETRH